EPCVHATSGRGSVGAARHPCVHAGGGRRSRCACLGRTNDRPAGRGARAPRTVRGGRMFGVSTNMVRAPKIWQGRFYEDVDGGDIFRSRFGRTVTEYDNLIFTCLTMNTTPLHFDRCYIEKTRWEQTLVNSTFTVALVTGMSVPDTSEHAAANLSWTDIKLPKP